MRRSNASRRILLVSLSPHLLVLLCVALAAAASAHAQNANPQPNANVGLPSAGVLNLNGGGNGNNSYNGSGAGANADFDSLIDLITSTVATESWAENGGGQAEIRPFPTGVMVDAAGTMKLIKDTTAAGELSEVRSQGASGVGTDLTARANGDKPAMD